MSIHIPTEPIPIIQPDSYPLSQTEARVKELLDAGIPHLQIRMKLHLGKETFRDAVFEVRKQEAIMAKKLNEEQKAKIMELRKQGMTIENIAKELRHSPATVCKALKDILLAEEPADKPEPIAQVAEPVTMTEEHTAEIPEAVIRAVEDKITELNEMIRDNIERISSITEHNTQFAERAAVLERWLREVQE